MTVNPAKEPSKKKSKASIVERCKLWNTGIKDKYKNRSIEVWRKIMYGAKESDIGMIDVFSYYAHDLDLPKVYYNYHTAEEKIYTLNKNSCASKNKPMGLPVHSFTNFYDKSMVLQFQSIEDATEIGHIKIDDSFFDIPRNYKKIEWNPDLFKH
jgi:hypothetical protein